MSVSNKVSVWIGRNLFVLIGVLVAMFASTMYIVQTNNYDSEIAAQEARIAELEAEIAGASKEFDSVSGTMASQVVGFDTARVEKDIEQAKRLMDTAATWRNVDEYIAARDNIMKNWSLTEDSEFMTVFLPGEDEGAFRKDSKGNLHFAYPEANSTMRDFQSTLVGIDKDDRSKWDYFGVVTIEVKAPNEGSIKRNIAVEYSVGADNKILEVKAYPSNKDSITSK